MIPVNIRCDHQVWSHWFNGPIFEPECFGERPHSVGSKGGNLPSSNDPGRDEGDYLINDAPCDCIECQIGAAFNHQGLNIASGQVAGHLDQVRNSHDHFVRRVQLHVGDAGVHDDSGFGKDPGMGTDSTSPVDDGS